MAIHLRMGALALFLASGHVQGQDTDDPSSADFSRHRLDLSYIAIDSRLADSSIWALGYAYSLTSNTNLSVSTPLLDPSLDITHDSGIGDTTLAFSWTPMQSVSVRPWVPKLVGSGLQVTLPTGDSGKGRGLDATLVTPFLGMAVPLNDRVTLLPSLSYTQSLDKTVLGTDVRFVAAELGVNYLHPSRWWVSVFGAYLYDLEVDERYWNYAVSAGLLLTEHWGGSIEFARSQYFEPGVVASPAIAVDGLFSFNLHYNF